MFGYQLSTPPTIRSDIAIVAAYASLSHAAAINQMFGSYFIPLLEMR